MIGRPSPLTAIAKHFGSELNSPRRRPTDGRPGGLGSILNRCRALSANNPARNAGSGTHSHTRAVRSPGTSANHPSSPELTSTHWNSPKGLGNEIVLVGRWACPVKNGQKNSRLFLPADWNTEWVLATSMRSAAGASASICETTTSVTPGASPTCTTRPRADGCSFANDAC
jgi:hypothetical protein